MTKNSTHLVVVLVCTLSTRFEGCERTRPRQVHSLTLQVRGPGFNG